MKQMASFMRERTQNLAHPLDLMNNEAEDEEERIQLQQNGLLPPEAKVLGRPWHEFLRQGSGVNELFYEQLLRENVRMEKEFMQGIHELHAFDNENALIGNVLVNHELVAWQRAALATACAWYHSRLRREITSVCI